MTTDLCIYDSVIARFDGPHSEAAAGFALAAIEDGATVGEAVSQARATFKSCGPNTFEVTR